MKKTTIALLLLGLFAVMCVAGVGVYLYEKQDNLDYLVEITTPPTGYKWVRDISQMTIPSEGMEWERADVNNQ